MGVNSLPKIVARQRCGCDLNPGPSAPESSTLTTRLPSHPPWVQPRQKSWRGHRTPSFSKPIPSLIAPSLSHQFLSLLLFPSSLIGLGHTDKHYKLPTVPSEKMTVSCRGPNRPTIGLGWLGSRVVSVLDSGAEGPGFKSQPRRCRVTVLGKLFTPIVPLFTKQQNW